LREPSDITLAEESLLQDVQWLIDQGDYHGREADKKRLEYINNFRLEVYGAVVTGPVRELEKLKAEKDFYHYELGPVEVWNWQTEE
ncbi:MAG TPA: anti sigma factor C-terminal domain-containing protein, partial [Bacilli bacterium]|nr:anti sigma factor C-terminal domain-containing protein [Bacilli bacterium]